MAHSSSDSKTVGPLYPPVGGPQLGDLETNPPISEDAPTVGYKLNHLMLRIRDPKATMHFYVDLMGMRTVFRLNTGPFTIYYLGYPQTPAHRADPSLFSKETAPHSVMSKTLGLLELCHYHGSENQPASYISSGTEPPNLGFNHIGFTVPDVDATIKRLRAEGVKVIKEASEGPVEGIPTTKWERETHGIATDDLNPGFGKIIRQIGFVEDPNGYLIEIVPQELKF